jgi:phosphate/sulfate permease
MTRYLNPPHNSVLTIVFHVGLIPALLFFTPLKKTFTQLFLKKSPADANILFLVLALLGSLVWILFNVILELPHSSTYFWLVYLTTIFYLKETFINNH